MRTSKAIVEPRRIPVSEALARAQIRKPVLVYTGPEATIEPWGVIRPGDFVEVWSEQAAELLRTGMFRPR